MHIPVAFAQMQIHCWKYGEFNRTKLVQRKNVINKYNDVNHIFNMGTASL